ncbi:PEP-CTERM system TPR-repeat protein PrsT [Alteromonadaceae bacterium M269]|nr:PEP-CTERM system TPR-repeat protein PrsT [Alteromonadaceae bacterium M269]
MRLLFILVALTYLVACSKQTSEGHLEAAKQFIANGDNSAAIVELKNAIQKDPQLAEARFELGKIYVELKQFDAASKELGRALDNGFPPQQVLPILSKAYQKSGADVALSKIELKQAGLTSTEAAQIAYFKLQSMMRLGEIENAKAVIEEIKTYETNSPYKLLAVVMSLLVGEKKDLALIQAQQVLEQFPEHEETLLLNANLLIGENKRDEAIELYQRYNKLFPEDNTNAFILARLLVDSGRTEEAEPIVDKLLAIQANNSLLNQLKGVIRAKQEDFEQALEYTEKAITNDSNDPALRLVAGHAAFQLKDYDKAHQHLSIIATLLPENHPGLKLLAASQLNLGLSLEASATLEQTEAIDKEDALLFSSAGYERLRAGDFIQARELVEQSAKVSESAEDLTRLGILRLSLNDLEGIVDLEKALEQQPDLPLTKATLATAYLANNDLDKALDFAEEWKKSDPESGKPLLLSGTVYYKRKQFEQAAENFAQSIKLEPNEPRARLALMEALTALGKTEEVTQELEKAIAQAPTNVELLAKLYQLKRQDNDGQAAIEQIRQARQSEPQNLNLNFLLARVLLAEQKPTEAWDLLEQLTGDLADNETYMRLRGMAAIRSNKYQDASEHYEEWLENSPNNKNAMLGQAFFLDQRGDFKQGLEISSRFIEQRPDDIQMLLVHTHFLIMTGDFINGERFFVQLPEFAADLPASKGMLARIQASKNEFEPALPNAYAAYEAQPSSRNVLLNIFLLERLGLRDETLAFLSKHTRKYPRDETSLMLYAERNIAADKERAIANYESVVELNPNNFIVLNNLAYLYQEEGRLDEAEEYAEKAVSIRPENPDALDTLAQIKLAKKELKSGLDILAKAVNQKNVSDEIYVNYIEALLINDQKVLASRRIEEREIQNESAKEKLDSLKQTYSL